MQPAPSIAVSFKKKQSELFIFRKINGIHTLQHLETILARHFIIATTAVAAGESRPVSINGRRLLVCHTADQFFVIENECSHAKARLTGGKLRGCRIFCPLHSAAFDLSNGQALSAPATEPITVFGTSVEDGQVYAELPDA